MRPLRAHVAALCLGSCLAALPAAAAEQDLDPVVQAWLGRMQTIDGLLHTGAWADARRLSNELLAELALRLVTRGSGIIGTALLQRAVALEALGEHDAALWDAFVADALATRTRQLLAGYGPAGAALLAGLTEEPEQAELELVGDSGLGLLALPDPDEETEFGASADRAPLMVGGHVSAPTKRSGRDPVYPNSARQGRVEELIIVQVIIDEQGRPSRPDILRGGAHPILALNALEAMKEWTFDPAMLHGKPVEVYYTLTVNFQLN